MGTLTIQLRPFFDWLLWVSLQGSVLIGLIVLIQLILRGKLGIRWHYLLWMLLLIRLAVPYLPQSKISIYNLVPQSIQYKLTNPISMTTDSIFRSKIVPCQTVTSENNIKQSKPETAQDTMPKPIEEPKTVASDTQPTNQNRPFGAILLGFVRMLP
jgi:hypothetical protein